MIASKGFLSSSFIFISFLFFFFLFSIFFYFSSFLFFLLLSSLHSVSSQYSSTYLFLPLSFSSYLYIYLSTHLSIYLPFSLFFHLPRCKVERPGRAQVSATLDSSGEILASFGLASPGPRFRTAVVAPITGYKTDSILVKLES